MTNGSPSVRDLILVPSIITLAVTVLRLVGELRRWNEVFFGRGVGGGGAVVGISWLAILFAVYFALRLRKAGQAFQSSGKAIGLSVLALALFVGGTALMFAGGDFKFTWKMAAGLLVILVSIWVMRVAWPVYWNVMMTYALAARIPVLIVMYFAFQGNWNTHYDAVPRNVNLPDLTAKFIALGLIPQLVFWIPFTVIACGLLGTIAAAIRKAPARMDIS